MVDLFGKRQNQVRIVKLEARIASLEEERQSMEKTLAKRDERIKRLTRDYQEANVALKEAERRLASIQAVAKSQSSEAQESDGLKRVPSGLRIGPGQLKRLLTRLEGCRSPEADLVTACLAGGGEKGVDLPGGLPGEVEDLLRSLKSKRGVVLLHSPDLFSLAVVPPFPLAQSLVQSSSFDLMPLRDQLDTPVLLVSAHAGDTLLGVALSAEGFQTVEPVKSQVKEKHSKGGWSQRRFERLREEEMRDHGEEVKAKLKLMAERYGSLVRYVVQSGDPALIKAIQPVADLPVVERRLDRHDWRHVETLLGDLYGFVLYRS